jgi:hypothetical protein
MSDTPPVPGVDFITPGMIVDGSAIDSASVIPEQANSKYPPYPIQGATNYPTPLPTIRTGATKEVPAGLPVIIVNPALPPLPVPGTWDNLIPPLPPPLVRTGITGVQNPAARGVYMDKVLVPVSGDAVQAVGGIPNPRPLTGFTIYPTIIIGTKS